MGGGAHQHDDVAPAPAALARDLLQPPREQARLGRAPRRGRAQGAPERRFSSSSPKRASQRRFSRSVTSSSTRGSGAGPPLRPACSGSNPSPHRREKARSIPSSTSGPAAEVHGHALGAALGVGLGVVAGEHLDVGVAEAVDRLALVADAEQVAAVEHRQQLVLQRVHVLELVHQHVVEALGVGEPDALVARQQVAGDQLEVLEVEPGALALEPLEVVAVALHQRRQQLLGAALVAGHHHAAVGGERLQVLAARGVDCSALVFPGLKSKPFSAPSSGSPPSAVASRQRSSFSIVLADGLAAGVRLQVGRRGQRGGRQPRRLGRPVGRLGRQLHPRVADAAAALPGEGGAHHVAQAVGRVGGHLLQVVAGGLAQEVLDRAVEGVEAQALGLQLVQHPVLGVDPGAQRVGAKHARAEAVDGGDPGSLGGAGLVAHVELHQPLAHPLLHLGRGLLGEGDREDPLHLHLVLAHRLHEALHEHRCLAGARPGAHQQRHVAALDRGLLLGGELGRHQSSDRQIEG